MSPVFLTDSSLEFGHQQQQLMWQAAGLRDMGYASRVFCPRGSQTSVECKRELLPVEHLTVNPALAVASLARVVRQVVKHQPRSIFCHGEYDAYLFAIAVHLCYALGLIKYRPFLVRMRFCQTHQPRALLVNRAFDLTTVASRVLSDRLLDNRYLDSRKVEVLPPIVEFQRLVKPSSEGGLSQATKERLAQQLGPVVLFDGSVGDGSSCEMLALELMVGLVEHHKNILFVFPHQGVSHSVFKAQLFHLGLQSNVWFAAQKDSLDGLLERADIVLLPDASGGFELAQIKAVAYGKPVVVSHLGILAELLEHNRCAMVCSPPHLADAKSEWFAAINSLLNNAELARTMGLSAREMILKSLGLQAHLQRVVQGFASTSIES